MYKSRMKLIKYIGICVGIFATSVVQAEVVVKDILNSTTSNPITQNSVALNSTTQCQSESLENAFLCGKISGRLNTLYYSTHNAYFVPDLNQDTITTGGFIKFETQPIAGLSAGISYAGQWRLDDKDPNKAEVTELSQDKDGLAEAYIDWRNADWKIRLGQQSLDVPFVGHYDWRVMPPLFRAADVQYGTQHDYVRATWIDRFKSYADDQFEKTSRYSSEIETDGMWSIGAAKSFDFADQKLKTQALYQSYTDYNRLAYLEAHLQWEDLPYQPDLGIQAMWSESQGKELAGNTDHQGVGISLALKILNGMTFKTAYNYIKPNEDSYLNGALFTPYMIYTASGPYFAQPFFTSTQDLGAGHAAMLSIEGSLNEQTYVGANYSFMHLTEADDVKNLNQSEYVIYGIYNFDGGLKGWSIANFFGVVTSPRYEDVFIQNRLGLKYSF